MKRDKRKYRLEHDLLEGVMLQYKSNEISLRCGLRDTISVHYYDKHHFFVLSYRVSLGYIGGDLIVIIDPKEKTMDRIGDIFFKNAEEDLRPDIFKLSDCKKADIVADYIIP